MEQVKAEKSKDTDTEKPKVKTTDEAAEKKVDEDKPQVKNTDKAEANKADENLSEWMEQVKVATGVKLASSTAYSRALKGVVIGFSAMRAFMAMQRAGAEDSTTAAAEDSASANAKPAPATAAEPAPQEKSTADTTQEKPPSAGEATAIEEAGSKTQNSVKLRDAVRHKLLHQLRVTKAVALHPAFKEAVKEVETSNESVDKQRTQTTVYLLSRLLRMARGARKLVDDQKALDHHPLNDQLLYAAQENKASFIRSLVRRKADINLIGADGHTPLMVAAHFEAEDAVLELLEFKADPNILAEDGVTAILLAAFGNSVKIVEGLLAAGADQSTELSGRTGETALYLASQEGHVGVVSALCKAPDCPINKRAEGLVAPLFMAAHTGNLAVAKALCTAKNVDLDIVNHAGATPLLTATQCMHTDIAEFLLSAKANLNAVTDNNISPLKMAVLTKNTRLTDLYIKSGAHVHFKRSENVQDVPDYENANVLAEAAALNCDVPMLKLLLEHKVDPTLKTSNGQSVVSVIKDQYDITLEELLNGNVPEHVVHQNNKKEVVEWWSFEDEEGDIFYFNTRIRMSTWSKPENVKIEHKGKLADNAGIMASGS